MDLSRLKWPLIIFIVAAIGWLGTAGGVSWMENKFSQGTPGANAEQDAANEMGLSRLGGFLLKTFRYARAEEVFQKAMDRYPTGSEYWYNMYRQVKVKEKLGKQAEAVQLLKQLIAANANSIDSRVPENDNLNLRAEKLIEVNELEQR